MKQFVLAAMILAAGSASPAYAQGRGGRGTPPPPPATVDVKAVLDAAVKAMGVDKVTSIQYMGNGTNNAFGQQPAPNHPWPAFKLTGYTMTIDYKTPAMRFEYERNNPDGPAKGGGGLPLLAPQKVASVLSGMYAWNVPANPPAGQPAAAPTPAAVAPGLLQIWTTPHGALKAAQRVGVSGITAVAAGSDRVFSYWVDGQLIKTTIAPDDTVSKVEWLSDMPMMGDTLTETKFLAYKDRGNGVKFPSHIHQTQGGYAIFDLNVTDVKVNAPLMIQVPQNVKEFKAPPPTPVQVDVQKVADGVYYLTGGSHHSVAVEFADHVVLIEAPLNEARVVAVVDAVKKTIPNKPIRYVVNTHDHFDHAGGLRTAAAEDLTIVTQTLNRYWYERLFQMPHSINWDLLSRNGKTAKFETVADKRVLSDATREVQLIRLPTDHSETMLVAYLPKEKILVEADLFNPPAANAPAAPVNPVTVQFYDELQKQKLDVNTILPIHGRQVTMKDLQAAAGKSAAH